MNTSAFTEALVGFLNTVKPGFKVYYDRAPKDKTFPYGVISYVTASDLDEGDLTSFDLDIWTDDKLPSATVELESLCDLCRKSLNKKVLSIEGKFASHIGYESRDTSDDREDDLSHRRQIYAARIFYINEEE